MLGAETHYSVSGLDVPVLCPGVRSQARAGTVLYADLGQNMGKTCEES
jgi:hypothetical protein